MAHFDPKSRYAGLPLYEVPGPGGLVATVVPVPDKPSQTLRGVHRRRQGQRLDHLAFRYLDDPAGTWRIAELADAMWPDALAETPEVPIPTKR
jgi:hypothetical protein